MQRDATRCTKLYVAEGGGFEPPKGYKPLHAFQACDFNHSSTPPEPEILTQRAKKNPGTRPGWDDTPRDHRGGLGGHIVRTRNVSSLFELHLT